MAKSFKFEVWYDEAFIMVLNACFKTYSTSESYFARAPQAQRSRQIEKVGPGKSRIGHNLCALIFEARFSQNLILWLLLNIFSTLFFCVHYQFTQIGLTEDCFGTRTGPG